MKHHPQRLVELLGGVDTVRAAVHLLYDRLLRDPDLNSYFNHVDLAVLRAHMTSSLVLVLDTADDTTDLTQEEIRLQQAHAHLHITDNAFDQTAGHLLDILAELEVDPHVIDDAILKIAALRPHIVHPGSPHLSPLAVTARPCAVGAGETL